VSSGSSDRSQTLGSAGPLVSESGMDEIVVATTCGLLRTPRVGLAIRVADIAHDRLSS
jgi:hypothetical protein